MRFSLDLESSIPFYLLIFSFISYLLHFLLHFFHFLEGRSEPVHSAKKGMGSLDDSYSLTGYEPNAHDLKETYVESCTELLDSPPFFSDTGFPADAEYDGTMTPHSRTCCVKLTEYMSITPSEKTCLSISRRRQCPIERSNPLLNNGKKP